MIGDNLGHYTITELLGRGGMGEVYRARDQKLDRDVALKLLPPEMAANPLRLERFEREAKAVAAINHPHIVHLYSIEQEGDRRFLTMEMVEGRGLDAVLEGGPLPLGRVLDLGIAVADALAAAHDRGIVHRDLKPANIMVDREGRAKVLDFGVAKLMRDELTGDDDRASSQSAPLTVEGSILGTGPYMSPEQVRARDIDHRSDLWALGVILYEMAAGHRPFRGETPNDVLSAILREEPLLVTQLRPELPGRLGRIVARCLAKDARDRYSSALDLRDELRELNAEIDTQARSAERLSGSVAGPTTGMEATVINSGLVAPPERRSRLWMVIAAVALVAAVAVTWLVLGNRATGAGDVASTGADGAATTASEAAEERSIAVLPFADMSPEKDQEYFSDGISEELLNLLAKIPQLKVTARTSSFAFKGQNVEIPEIARQLGVAHILEGSVRKAGDKVRITAQLIHAADGFRLWSNTWDRTLDDVFAIQDEIAAEVVKELQVTLLGSAAKAQTTTPEAYALYLQAKELGSHFTAESFAESDRLIRQVLEIDPSYAPAWVLMASNITNQAGSGRVTYEEAIPRANEAAQKALAIDPNSAEAVSTLAWNALLENDLPGAARQLERALELDPTRLGSLGNASSILGSLGRLDESLALHELVARRDPVNTTSLSNLGNSLMSAGRLDDALDTYRTVLRLNPQRGGAHFGLGLSLLMKGDAAGALAELEQETNDLWRLIGLPLVYYALGRDAESDAALAELVAKYERDTAYNIAYVHAFRGEADQAFAWLDKAVEYRDPGLSEILGERLFDNVRDDPRWLPFLRKIGRAPEQLAQIEFHVTLPEGW